MEQAAREVEPAVHEDAGEDPFGFGGGLEELA